MSYVPRSTDELIADPNPFTRATLVQVAALVLKKLEPYCLPLPYSDPPGSSNVALVPNAKAAELYRSICRDVASAFGFSAELAQYAVINVCGGFSFIEDHAATAPDLNAKLAVSAGEEWTPDLSGRKDADNVSHDETFKKWRTPVKPPSVDGEPSLSPYAGVAKLSYTPEGAAAQAYAKLSERAKVRAAEMVRASPGRNPYEAFRAALEEVSKADVALARIAMSSTT